VGGLFALLGRETDAKHTMPDLVKVDAELMLEICIQFSASVKSNSVLQLKSIRLFINLKSIKEFYARISYLVSRN
jgi:hypothetical protein